MKRDRGRPAPESGERKSREVERTELEPRSAEETLPVGLVSGDAGMARFDRYRIGAVLGRGGMGEVFLALDPELDRRVALKRLRPEAEGDPGLVERFLREARLTAQLDHPNIVPVHDLARDSRGGAFFTMKEVRGRTLKDVIETGSMTLAQLLRVFVKVCDAVAFAHSRGVLHRDLKPSNVMVGEYGEVLVMDWGLAKIRGQATGDRSQSDRNCSLASDPCHLTVAGTVLGTPAYMSPEQRGGLVVDETSDVYLLGGILYEILTGKAPGERVERPSRRAPGREIPRELESIAMRALEERRERRYPDAVSMQADVVAYLDGRLVQAARYSSIEAGWKWAKRHRAITAAAGAILVTLAISATLIFLGRARNERTRRADHAKRVREARETLLAIHPGESLARARREIEAPDAASSRIETHERIEGLLAELNQASEAHAAILALEPDDREAREGRFDVLLALGRLAWASEDDAFAEFAFQQASGLGVDDERARELGARLAGARREVLAKHRASTIRLLERAAEGELAASDDYEDALTELTSYRERQTVELLAMRLDEVTRRLRDATRDWILDANRLTAEEVARGDGSIEGLEAAVLAWLDSERPRDSKSEAPESPSVEDRAKVALAAERLERRAFRPSNDPHRILDRQGLLADVLERELRARGQDEVTLVRLVSEVLGLLGDPRGAVDSLAAYVYMESDEVRALPAGIALARLAGPGSPAERVILSLMGLRIGERRIAHWSMGGVWWRHVGRRMARRDAGSGLPSERPSASATDHLTRGLVRLSLGDVADAASDFDRAIELDPALAIAWGNRGAARRLQGDFARSIVDLDRAIELAPDLGILWHDRALTRLERGEYAEAFADLDRAIALDPYDAARLATRGVAWMRKGDAERALEDAGKALELDSRNSVAHHLVGRVRRDRGDLQGALTAFEKSAAADRWFLGAWRDLARTRRMAKDLPGTIAAYDRLLAVHPQDADACLGRAAARRDVGDLDAALADCSRALEASPELPQGYAILAEILHMRGEGRSAVEAGERALELAPDAPWADSVHQIVAEARDRSLMEELLERPATTSDEALLRARAHARRARRTRDADATDLRIAVTEIEAAKETAPTEIAREWAMRFFTAEHELALALYERGYSREAAIHFHEAFAASGGAVGGGADLAYAAASAHAKASVAIREGSLAVLAENDGEAQRLAAGLAALGEAQREEEARSETDEAFSLLEAACAAGWRGFAQADLDPDVASLRNDSRWRALAERFRGR